MTEVHGRTFVAEGRICENCKGDIPYWKRADAKTCSWQCADQRRKARRKAADAHA